MCIKNITRKSHLHTIHTHYPQIFFLRYSILRCEEPPRKKPKPSPQNLLNQRQWHDITMTTITKTSCTCEDTQTILAMLRRRNKWNQMWIQEQISFQRVFRELSTMCVSYVLPFPVTHLVFQDISSFLLYSSMKDHDFTETEWVLLDITQFSSTNLVLDMITTNSYNQSCPLTSTVSYTCTNILTCTI